MDAFEKAERRAELERAIAAGEQALPILQARADAAAQAEAEALAPFLAAKHAWGEALRRRRNPTESRAAEAAWRATEPALLRARTRATRAAHAVGEQRRRLSCWRGMLASLDAPPTPPPPRTGWRWLSWSGV